MAIFIHDSSKIFSRETMDTVIDGFHKATRQIKTSEKTFTVGHGHNESCRSSVQYILTHLMIPLPTSGSRSRQIGQCSSPSTPSPSPSAVGWLAFTATLFTTAAAAAAADDVDDVTASLARSPSVLMLASLASVPAPGNGEKRGVGKEDT